MIRAFVIKELRESAALAGLAALAIAYALAALTGWQVFGAAGPIVAAYVPFVDTPVVTMFAAVGGGFAALLGLKQSAWEDLRGTYHYLFHRPIARSRVILVKLAVGLALVQIAGAALIVLHALWAATPGNHGSPFYWNMTADAWRAWTVLPVIYLAAVLSGLRPAAWYGTRLAPLVAAAAMALGLAIQPFWQPAAIVSAILSALLAACVIHAAEARDY